MSAFHVEAQGGDVEKSLAAVSANRSTRASLADLGGPEIEATLARVAMAKNVQASEMDGDDDNDRAGNRSIEPDSTLVVQCADLNGVLVVVQTEINRYVDHDPLLHS